MYSGHVTTNHGIIIMSNRQTNISIAKNHLTSALEILTLLQGSPDTPRDVGLVPAVGLSILEKLKVIEVFVFEDVTMAIARK